MDHAYVQTKVYIFNNKWLWFSSTLGTKYNLPQIKAWSIFLEANWQLFRAELSIKSSINWHNLSAYVTVNSKRDPQINRQFTLITQ